MSTFLSKEVREGLEAAHRLARARRSRLRVRTADAEFPVIRFWEDGFAVEVETAPRLRGFVDIYDGPEHLTRCLIVASDEEAGERRYDFKRATPVSDSAPLDFERPDTAPVALIGPS
ncbi:hypothetical protein ATO6_06890 [Oceanicola sp. 22II-s10i]|uniref:hypothetical protein n=1 Tax=Oceanicola sp. 22II-s10i TaxID=1317116 RepID=UPI000B524A66|nr:hypothetical protein [Oceanicola sp. 22II-s10i]OWU86518.1 hypothetical protein ATO6_06890 [Oceanicola sp. 22II-s10i]